MDCVARQQPSKPASPPPPLWLAPHQRNIPLTYPPRFPLCPMHVLLWNEEKCINVCQRNACLKSQVSHKYINFKVVDEFLLTAVITLLLPCLRGPSACDPGRLRWHVLAPSFWWRDSKSFELTLSTWTPYWRSYVCVFFNAIYHPAILLCNGDTSPIVHRTTLIYQWSMLKNSLPSQIHCICKQ